MSTLPRRSPEQISPLVGQTVEFGGSKMQVTDVTGNAATLQRIDPRTGELKEGSINGSYIPLDDLERLLHKSDVQGVRNRVQGVLDQNQVDQLRTGQKIPHVVLKTEEKGLVKDLHVKSMDEDWVKLADHLGKIDPQTLQRHMQEGERLAKKYDREFSLRSGSDPRVVYNHCHILGINIANGDIIVGFIKSDGNRAHKTFESEKVMQANIVRDK